MHRLLKYLLAFRLSFLRPKSGKERARVGEVNGDLGWYFLELSSTIDFLHM